MRYDVYALLASITWNMKKLISLLILSGTMACNPQESSQLISIWGECLKDGTYKQYQIANSYTATSVSDFQDHDYDDGISFYECYIHDSLLIISKGINVDLIDPPETLRFEFISKDRVTLKNKYGNSELIRINNEIPDIDSTNLILWRKLYLDAFLNRAELANCSDFRKDEEKQQPVELGTVENDFEDLQDIEE